MSAEHAGDLPEFDGMWDYGDPAGTERKFRELLPAARSSGNAGYLAELLTQIARTQGLQQKFEDAGRTLDEADALILPAMRAARVRSLLERGRVLNSSGKALESRGPFGEALRLAREAGLEFYAVDAAHMLGIAAPGEESLRWNGEAMKLAEAAADPRARRWRGSLYNNTGWTLFELGRYREALEMFEKSLAFRREMQQPAETNIARWCVAKTMRMLGRVEEALAVQRELLEAPERRGNASEGYTREEMAECLLALGCAKEAAPEFARAWELLHEDPWLKRDEAGRLERLKRLGETR